MTSKLLELLLATEEAFIEKTKNTNAAKKLKNAHCGLRDYVRSIHRSGDLSSIINTERIIVEVDLARYANSKQMISSLKAALGEITAIECHLAIVDDPAQYKVVNLHHSLPRNRKNGLPFDEARQALASHYARLNNMDKSRLDDDEKAIIDARKTALLAAIKLYSARQAKTLGIDPSQQM